MGLTLLLILLITFVSFPATASPDTELGPYSDQLWFNVVTTPDAQLMALLVGEKDVGVVPIPQDIDTLQEAGLTVVATERIGYTILFENNGIYPFDSIALRRSVNRLVDKETKAELWSPLMVPVYYYVPPSQPKWLNPDAPLPAYAPMEAIGCLMAGDDSIPGTEDDYEPILIDPGLPPAPGNIENWIDPDTGLPMEEFEYMTRSLEESPLSFEDAVIIYEELISIGLPVVLYPTSFVEIVMTLFLPPDDDWQMISGLGLVWDQTPQFLYDFFHSEGSYNLWGVDDPELDFWCEELLLATNQADAEFAADMIQERAVELEPFLPLFMWVTYTAFNDNIIGIVNMKGYGAAAPRNRWTKMLIRKCTGDPQVHWMLPYYIDSLNPLCSQTESASQILYAVEDLLMEKNPYVHEPMPWAAEEMPVVADWITPTGDPGQSMTFTLRDDIFWHDGVQVDAADAVFTLNLLRFQENAKYLSVWQHIYDVVQLTAFSFVVYYTQPYYWAYEGISEVALLCPEHIWEPWVDSPETGEPLVIEEGAGPMGGDVWILPGRHHSEWMGWEEAYMEDPQYPGMLLTNLIGCGPFIYHLGGWEPGIGVHIEANRNYFAGRICPADVNLDQMVDMDDVWQVLYRQGAYPCHPRWHREVNGMTGVAADIACPAQLINGAEIFVVMAHFGHQWGPGIPPCDP